MTKTIEAARPTLTPFEGRIYDALRAEVRELAEGLKQDGPALSPRLLAAASERLAEVARFAAVFAKNGVAPEDGASTSMGVGIKILDGGIAAPAPDPEARGPEVAALKKAGKTWREISAATGLSITQARYLYRKNKKARAR